MLNEYEILEDQGDDKLIRDRISQQQYKYRILRFSEISGQEVENVIQTFTKHIQLEKKSVISYKSHRFYKEAVQNQSLFDSFKSNFNLSVELIFEPWIMNFQHEIDFRLGTQQFYSSEEIINSIELALLGLNTMHNSGIIHGNLTPSHICVNSEGEIFISDQFILAPYIKIPIRDKISAKSNYLSPEELQNWEKPRFQLQAYHDIWSLGMIFLQSLLLQKVEDIYDYEHNTLSFFRLNCYLSQVQEKYDSDVYLVMSTMLNENPTKRLNVYAHYGQMYRFYINTNKDSKQQILKNSNENVGHLITEFRVSQQEISKTRHQGNSQEESQSSKQNSKRSLNQIQFQHNSNQIQHNSNQIQHNQTLHNNSNQIPNQSSSSQKSSHKNLESNHFGSGELQNSIVFDSQESTRANPNQYNSIQINQQIEDLAFKPRDKQANIRQMVEESIIETKEFLDMYYKSQNEETQEKSSHRRNQSEYHPNHFF